MAKPFQTENTVFKRKRFSEYNGLNFSAKGKKS